MGRLNRRRRTLDPSICTDEDLALLGPWEQILFERLPMIADRLGRLEDRPMAIRAAIFPYSDSLNVDELLEALAGPREYSEGGFIIRYEAAGRKYIQIRNFKKYQKPHLREIKSEIPDPPEPEAEPKHGQGTTQAAPRHNPGTTQAAPRRPDPDPDPDPDPRKSDPPLRSGSEGSKPPGPPEAPELELAPPEPPPAALEASSNPFRFAVFWVEANADRDFGLRFEPEDGLAELVDAEVERLELEGRASRDEISSQVRATCEAFRSTYTKRTGRKNAAGKRKTRGASTSPGELTETLVGWIRKDLARLAARSQAPARRGGLRSVDSEIKKSVKRGRAIDAAGKGKGSKWPPRKRLR